MDPEDKLKGPKWQIQRTLKEVSKAWIKRLVSKDRPWEQTQKDRPLGESQGRDFGYRDATGLTVPNQTDNTGMVLIFHSVHTVNRRDKEDWIKNKTERKPYLKHVM